MIFYLIFISFFSFATGFQLALAATLFGWGDN
jgi:hypothetical protein